MTDRLFRLMLGIGLLVLLWFDRFQLIGVLILYLVFEGLTNWRPARPDTGGAGPDAVHSAGVPSSATIPFEAERALRLVMASALFAAVYLYPDGAWWLAWFVAFAVLGAGISGVCPLLSSLRLLGFR